MYGTKDKIHWINSHGAPGVFAFVCVLLFAYRQN